MSTRLILGDCVHELSKIPDGSVDMILTDPPFGHNNNNGDLINQWEKTMRGGYVVRENSAHLLKRGKGRPIANDGQEANDIFRKALVHMARLLVPGGCLCCCCSGGGGKNPLFARWSLWLDKVLDFKQMVVWDKGPIGMGWHYRRSYETILVATKPGAPCRWYDKSGRVENIIRPSHRGIRKIIPDKHQHPCAKPVELAVHFLRLHAKGGHTVLDPFMGAGWVGVACKRLGMKFIGVEIDPHWYGIAKKRIGLEPQGRPRVSLEETT